MKPWQAEHWQLLILCLKTEQLSGMVQKLAYWNYLTRVFYLLGDFLLTPLSLIERVTMTWPPYGSLAIRRGCFEFLGIISETSPPSAPPIAALFNGRVTMCYQHQPPPASHPCVKHGLIVYIILTTFHIMKPGMHCTSVGIIKHAVQRIGGLKSGGLAFGYVLPARILHHLTHCIW